MKIVSSSQLRLHHVAGVPLAAQRSVALAYTADRSPLLFSLDEANTLAVTLPSAASGTGWEQVDLGAQLAGEAGLGAAPTVQAFALSQDVAGTIWLVVAAATTATEPSQVFITTGLSNVSTAADWRGFSAHASVRQIPSGYVVSRAVIGGTGGDHPLAVVAATDATGVLHHLQLNPDPGPGDWQSLPLRFPVDTTRCRAMAVGLNDRYGQGVYTVCAAATGLDLAFTTVPTIVNGRPVAQTVQLALPAGLDPYAIVPVAAADGRTDLYAAGQGLYWWPVPAQTRPNRPAQQVAGPDAFAGVTELAAGADEPTGEVSVWGRDAGNVLIGVTGVRSAPDTILWQAPLPFAAGVTAVAAYRVSGDAGTSTAGLLLAGSGGELSLSVQDAQTTLWQRQTVARQQSGAVQALRTYTTRVVVTDDSGTPYRDGTVDLQPDADRAVLVNGAYQALRASIARPVRTDLNGVLTIVAETSDLTVPVYTITAGTTTVTEDPAAAAKEILRSVSDGVELARARRANGQPLFPTPPDRDTAAAAATAISVVMAVHDALVAGREPGVGGPWPARHPSSLVAVRVHDGRSRLLHGPAAAVPDRATGTDWLAVSAGDLLQALSGESTLTYWVDQVGNFCVQLGQACYRFAVDAAEKAIAVVDWVLRGTLGLSLDDLIAWLGFVAEPG